VAWPGRAEAQEILAAQLVERAQQVMLGAQPILGSVAVSM